MRTESGARLSFGDFEFDTASGELRRNGEVTRLAPQVAAVLAMLAGRGGEVVTRSELRDALWPDTTVEFDQGLNFCIRQLRVALSDDAAEPKYIETLHRRGYRFVAPVSAPARAAVVDGTLVGGQPLSTTVETTELPRFAGDDIQKAKTTRWRSIAAVCAALALLAAVRLVAKGTAPPAPRIAVLAFDRPADGSLGAYQAQLVELLVASVGRGQLDRVAVMGPSFTSRFSGSTTPPDSIRDAIGATHVLSGSLRVENGKVRVFAQLIRTSDRRHVWAARFFDSTAAPSHITTIADSIARATTTIVLRDRL